MIALTMLAVMINDDTNSIVSLECPHVKEGPFWSCVRSVRNIRIDDFGFRLLCYSHGNDGKGR